MPVNALVQKTSKERVRRKERKKERNHSAIVSKYRHKKIGYNRGEQNPSRKAIRHHKYAQVIMQNIQSYGIKLT